MNNSRNINKNDNILSFDTFSQLQRNSTDVDISENVSNIWKFKCYFLNIYKWLLFTLCK